MHDIPDDPKAVVATAITNEIEGHKILQQSKEASRTPLARATFEFLANEELRHIELIKEFAESLAEGKQWNPASLKETSLAEAGEGVRGIFARFATQFEEVRTSDDERLEVYKVAMDMERRGHDFYKGAAEMVSDTDAKALFRFLAGEERRHFQMIQDTHDFLEQPDALLAMEERWMQT